MGNIIGHKFEVVSLINENSLCYNFTGKNIITGEAVLVKKYKTTHISREYIDNLLEELKALKGLAGPHLLKLLEYEYIFNDLIVVYEEVKGRTLSDYMYGRMSMHLEQIITLFSIISRSLEFLSANNFCHGSLNPDNIYICDSGEIRLAGYVIDNEINLYNIQNHRDVSNIIFNAPEQVLRGLTTRASDVYGLGVLLYWLTGGKLPPDKGYRRGTRPDFKMPVNISTRMVKLIIHMLEPDKNNRLSGLSYIIKVLSDESAHIPEQPAPVYEKVKIFFARKLILVLIASCLLGSGMAYVYTYFVNYLTSIPEITLPDVRAMETTKAIKLLTSSGLKTKMAGERDDPSVPQNHIVATIPEGGRSVKKGRIVRLIVSKGKGNVGLPNFTGMKYEEAATTIEQLGLVPTISNKVFSIEYPKNTVLAQDPSPNSFITFNATVKITVSDGYPIELIVLPLPEDPSGKTVLVQVKFSVVEGWGETKVKIETVLKGHREVVYDEIHYPGDTMQMEFEEKRDAEVDIFFNDEEVYKTKVKDHLDRGNSSDLTAQ